MKKLRCFYTSVSLILIVGLAVPPVSVFAEAEIDVLDSTESEVLLEATELEEAEEENEILLPVTESEGGMTVANVVIYSYNPGFSDPYMGEFVELEKLTDKRISLAGLTVVYETSTGSEYTVLEFSEEHEMVGESLLLRLASSNEVKEAEDSAEVADLTYTRNMSQSAGRIKLKYGEEELDSLCWGLKETGCYPAFKTGKNVKPTTLVREISEDEVGDFEFVEDYVPSYDSQNPGLVILEIPDEVVEPQCRALEFTEIYTYYETAASEQFVEIYNNGDDTAVLDGCFVSYKNKNYALKGNLGARKFLAVYPLAEWGLTLTKNPTSANKLSIIDTDGETVDNLVYYNGQKKGVGFAKVVLGDGTTGWVQTYSVTAGAENVYQQFKTCPVGKVINLETGNCVNETVLTTTLAACPEGKYRNPLTGRCKSYATTASTELKPCAEGYERNPETNRCRKIVMNTGAEYPVVTEMFEEKRELVSVYAIVTVVVAGLGYIAFQYKDELRMKFAKK